MQKVVSYSPLDNAKNLTGGGTRHRNQIIDLVKGIGIVLMVFRHARAPYSDFVLLFHMAIFFIASGWLMNLTYADSISSLWIFFKKRLKSLWLPYFGFNAVFIVIHNVFLRLNVYTRDPDFLKTGILEKSYTHITQPYSALQTCKELVKAFFFKVAQNLAEHYGSSTQCSSL